MSKGKLVSKFYTLRRAFRECGLLPQDGKPKSDTNLTTADEGKALAIVDISADFKIV